MSADGIGFWPIVSVSADNQDSTIGRPLAPPRMLIVGPLRANLLSVKKQAKKQVFFSYFEVLEHSIWLTLMRQVATVDAVPIVNLATWSVVALPVSTYTKKTSLC